MILVVPSFVAPSFWRYRTAATDHDKMRRLKYPGFFAPVQQLWEGGLWADSNFGYVPSSCEYNIEDLLYFGTTEFMPSGSSSACNYRLGIMAHIHLLSQIDATVNFF